MLASISPHNTFVPIKNPKSPTLFITNALLPAFAAAGFLDQNEINKYELKPTNSQPKNITKKFDDMTRSNIEKTKKLKYTK